MRPLPKPTRHLPGSRAKLRVFRKRYLAGLSLFHPQDAKIPTDGPDVKLSKSVANNPDVDYGRFLTAMDRIINNEDTES